MKLASTLLLCAGLLASASAQVIPGTNIPTVTTTQVTTTQAPNLGLGLGVGVGAAPVPAPVPVPGLGLGLGLGLPTTGVPTTGLPLPGTGTGAVLPPAVIDPNTNYPVNAIFVQELPVVKSTVVPVPASFPGAQTYSVRYDVVPNAAAPLACIDITLSYATTPNGLATATAPIAAQTQCVQVTGPTTRFTQYPQGTYIVSQLPSLGTATVVGRYIEAVVPADAKYGQACVQAVRASGATFGATNTVTTRQLCLPILPAPTFPVAGVNQPIFFGL